MRVTELKVARRESYQERAGELIGTVTLIGDSGKQEVVLSNASLAQIFKVIAKDVQDTALQNATQTSKAMADAANAPMLVDATLVLGK